MSGNVPSGTIAKWQKLADMLVELTESDKLSWKETAEDEEFITSLSDHVITIAKVHRDMQQNIELTIHGKRGDVIDVFNDDDIGALEYWPKLRGLIQTIMRKSSGADEALDEILSELSTRNEIPF